MKVTRKQHAEVIMEAMQSDLKTTLEYVADIATRQPKVDKIAEDMETVKSDIAVLKVGHRNMQEKIDEIIVKLDKKADQKDHLALDRRVTKLERRPLTA